MSILDDLMVDPRALNQWGSGIQAGGEIIGGLSHIQFGQQAQAAANYQAQQLRINASEALASSQRQAYEVGRQADYVASTALARAAASGGGASDPTVVNLMARNAGEMAYRKSVALYQGEERARLLNMQADAKEFEGANVRANSMLVGASQFAAAGASLLRGSAKDASLYQRFGAGAPNADIGGNT